MGVGNSLGSSLGSGTKDETAVTDTRDEGGGAGSATTPGASEAQSSHVGFRFDLVPRSLVERAAKRFELGLRYPPFNYRKGLVDKNYILDRINHLREHYEALLGPRTKEEWEDDNLGAIIWGCAFLCEVLADPVGRKILEEIRRERGSYREDKDKGDR